MKKNTLRLSHKETDAGFFDIRGGDQSGAGARFRLQQSNLPNIVPISVSGDLNFTADNCQFISGATITAAGKLIAEINDSTVSDEVGMTNTSLILRSNNDNILATFNNITVLPSNTTTAALALSVAANIGDANAEVNNTLSSRSISINGNNAKTKIVDSTVGAAGQLNTDLWSNNKKYAVRVYATGIEGAAKLDISNSQLVGDINVYSYYGSTKLIFLQNYTDDGNVSLTGFDNVVNIDSATLLGNISFESKSDKVSDTVNSTVNITNTAYRGNITSTNKLADDYLALNVNNGGVVGGETVDGAQQITGFNRVGVNINYVDPVTPVKTVAADLQAAQTGLLASDDMIHRIAGSITQHLDARHMGENSAQKSDSNVWMDGIYSGSDRTAGTTQYSNDISGFQLGAG